MGPFAIGAGSAIGEYEGVASPASRLAFMFARACCNQHGFVNGCVPRAVASMADLRAGGLFLLPHKRQLASPPRAGRCSRELVLRARVVATHRHFGSCPRGWSVTCVNTRSERQRPYGQPPQNLVAREVRSADGPGPVPARSSTSSSTWSC
jgi:hypothetical protein